MALLLLALIYSKRKMVLLLAISLLFGGCSGGKTPATVTMRTISPTIQSAEEIPITGGNITPEPVGTHKAEATGTIGTVHGYVFEVQEFPVPNGSHPHDVAPAPDGTVWYTAQAKGELGHLDPSTGNIEIISLGSGSSPHGVIIGPDGAPWITDSGVNAIVGVDPETKEVKVFLLPKGSGNINLNTGVFDAEGVLWFTGQSGYFGRLDPKTDKVEIFKAPLGRGPYGITATPSGDVYYASLAGNHIARIDRHTGTAEVLKPPTERQGARRVWSDSKGRIWVSEWNAGQVAVYEPGSGHWREWRLPGENPQTYAVYVDTKDKAWLSDFGSNSLLRFDPENETFDTIPLQSPNANIRQIAGREGEVWGAESGADKLIVIRTP